MIKELNERQKEIYDYAVSNGKESAASKYSLSVSQVGYILYKNVRIERAKEQNPCFIKLDLGDGNEESDEEITFSVNGIKVKMNVKDLRKVLSL